MFRALHANDIILTAILGIWFLLTALRQMRKKKPQWLNKLDFLRLIPTWRFFGPNPVTWDYRLYLRTADNNNEWSIWRDVTPATSRGTMSFFWNPQRRVRKVFSTASRRVVSFPESKREDSWEYQMLLNYVFAQPADNSGGLRQFEINRCRILVTPDQREVVFRSEIIGA
jgi:hypothetical protein